MKKLIAAILTTLIFATAQANVIPNAPHIYVEGFAEIDVEPNQVKFSIGINETELDGNLAKAKVEQRLNKLLTLMQQLKIDQKDISASPYQINPAYDWQNGKRQYKGTDVRVTVYIMLNDVSKYADFINTLVNANISSIINSQAMLANERAVKQQVMKLAMTDAKTRANDLASLQDKVVTGVHSISEFNTRRDERYTLTPNQYIEGNSLNRPAMAQLKSADFSAPNLKMGTMKATATVYVVYILGEK